MFVSITNIIDRTTRNKIYFAFLYLLKCPYQMETVALLNAVQIRLLMAWDSPNMLSLWI